MHKQPIYRCWEVLYTVHSGYMVADIDRFLEKPDDMNTLARLLSNQCSPEQPTDTK